MKTIGFGSLTSYLGTGFGYNLIVELPANKFRGRISGITAGYANSGGFITTPGFGRVMIFETVGINDQIPYDPQFPVPLTTAGAPITNANIKFDYTITFRANDFNSVNIQLLDGIILNESKDYSVVLTYYNDYSGFFPPAPPILASLSVRGSYESMKNPFGELR
jgi:hypothetical protein